MRRLAVLAMLSIAVVMCMSGCAEMTPAQQGAAGGGLVGAATGGLLGGGRKATVIGAGVGALGGALLNDELKKDAK